MANGVIISPIEFDKLIPFFQASKTVEEKTLMKIKLKRTFNSFILSKVPITDIGPDMKKQK